MLSDTYAHMKENGDVNLQCETFFVLLCINRTTQYDMFINRILLTGCLLTLMQKAYISQNASVMSPEKCLEPVYVVRTCHEPGWWSVFMRAREMHVCSSSGTRSRSGSEDVRLDDGILLSFVIAVTWNASPCGFQ